MSQENIRIPRIEDTSSLESCTPNLMPFHIAYSGSAPMSTFFRVKENTEPIAGASSMTTEEQTPSPTSSSKLVGRVTKRLVAAFRGRVVQGVEMALPDGYGGLVLQSKSAASGLAEKEKGKREEVEPRARRGTRSTRKSKPEPVREVDVDGDVDEQEAYAATSSGDEGVTKDLNASHTFSSLVIWNPDILVDQGKDECARALTEWTAVAAELHRPEDE